MKSSKILFLSLVIGFSNNSSIWTMEDQEDARKGQKREREETVQTTAAAPAGKRQRQGEVDQTGWNELHIAAGTGDLDEIRRLIGNQLAQINSRINNPEQRYHGRTALHIAAVTGKPEVIRLLINEFGVDPNTPINNPGRPPHKCTALHAAAANGKLDVIQLLINGFGINPKTPIDNPGQPFNGWTSLHIAVDAGRLDVVQLLFNEFGVDLNTPINNPNQPSNGYTALHIAAETNKENIVDFLLSKNVDVRRTNSAGHTAFDIAFAMGNQALGEKILAAAKIFYTNACPICYEDFQVGKEAKILHCGHIFCRDCSNIITSSISPVCQLCRARRHFAHEKDITISPDFLEKANQQ